MIARELTPIQVARIFSVSPQTVRRWEAAGVLAPCRRLPGSNSRRYDPAEVEALRKEVMGHLDEPDSAITLAA